MTADALMFSMHECHARILTAMQEPKICTGKPLSASERANPLFSMGGGRSEADYQAFIKRYESTVCEALDECAKRDMVIAELKRKYE